MSLGYFTNVFPNKTYKLKLEKCLGGKLSKVRLTDTFVSQHQSGAGSSPAGSVVRDLNLQKLNFQYLTTSVAVVLVVR